VGRPLAARKQQSGPLKGWMTKFDHFQSNQSERGLLANA
jgi:hypothetical protein